MHKQRRNLHAGKGRLQDFGRTVQNRNHRDDAFLCHKARNQCSNDSPVAKDADSLIEEFASRAADRLLQNADSDLNSIVREEMKAAGAFASDALSDEILDRITEKLLEQPSGQRLDAKHFSQIENKINRLHVELEERLAQKKSDLIQKLVHRRFAHDQSLKLHQPEVWEKLQLEREKYFEQIALTDPALAKQIAALIAREESDGET